MTTVVGVLVPDYLIGGGLAAVIGGVIFSQLGSSFGEKAINAEVSTLSGKVRSIEKAIF